MEAFIQSLGKTDATADTAGKTTADMLGPGETSRRLDEAYRKYRAGEEVPLPYPLPLVALPTVGGEALPGASMGGRGPYDLQQMPTGHENVLKLFQERPDLLQWYKSATGPEQKQAIIQFIEKNYLRP